MTYVVKKTEEGLLEVGYYNPKGFWIPQSEWDDKRLAEAQVRRLNGQDVMRADYEQAIKLRSVIERIAELEGWSEDLLLALEKGYETLSPARRAQLDDLMEKP